VDRGRPAGRSGDQIQTSIFPLGCDPDDVISHGLKQLPYEVLEAVRIHRREVLQHRLTSSFLGFLKCGGGDQALVVVVGLLGVRKLFGGFLFVVWFAGLPLLVEPSGFLEQRLRMGEILQGGWTFIGEGPVPLFLRIQPALTELIVENRRILGNRTRSGFFGNVESSNAVSSSAASTREIASLA
jgi:hypothetical protein